MAKARPPLDLPTPEGPGRTVDLVAQIFWVVAIIRRRWKVTLAVTVACVALSVAALVVLGPTWRASTTIVLHVAGPQVLDKVQGVDEELDGRASDYREYYQTQRRILSSRTVAEKALHRLGLADDPVFLGIDHIRSEAERLARRKEIDPVERLREIVDIQEIRNSRVIEVAAEYPDPQIAAEIANAVANAYLEHVRTSRVRLGQEAEETLTTERAKSLEELRTAEKQLESFKRDHAITSVSLEDRQNVITQNILTLSGQVKQTEAERIALEATHRQVEQLRREGDLSGATLLPEEERSLFEMLRRDRVEAEREFERINVQYGPKAPEYRKAKARVDLVNAKITDEEQALRRSLRARLDAARDTERALQASLAREQKDALTLSQLEREYRELERESKTSSEAYAMVARRETEIGMTNRVGAETIEVLDRAAPPREPFSPNQPVILGFGLIGGLCLGALFALSVDARDQRIRMFGDLERTLVGSSLPVLGQLPSLAADTRLGTGNVRAQRRQRDLYAHLFPQSMMAERCRTIRTNLVFAAPPDRPLRTIMITSPSSTEGKSSTATNLAISFCQAQKRVVLLDADMRRPRLHQIFPPPVNREGIGFAQVLQGKVSVGDALVEAGPEGPENLRILPCGEPPENPAELLQSPGCRRVLAELLDIADVVIIDSPPVLPVTDPTIMARFVDGVCMVARCDTTTRGGLVEAIATLRQGDTNLVGVILNEVTSRKSHYAYDYGYYTYPASDRQPERA